MSTGPIVQQREIIVPTPSLPDSKARLPYLFVILLALVCSPPCRAQGSAAPAGPAGCSRNKDTYTCDWEAFRRLLPHMRSVTVEAPAMDLYAAGQLRRLVNSIGKNVAAQGQPADLTFLLVGVDPTGIDYGPRDRPLASLQVYSGNGLTGDRKLLWVETFSGQPDRPWPNVVNSLIEQFQAHVGAR